MERERITISIKKAVLNQVDGIIDGLSIRNRSHAFETLALKALGRTDKLEAIIMLGGDEALKSIPLAENFIKKAKSIGITDIIIATGFLGDKIKERLGDGSQYGVKLLYSTEGKGTGGALYVLKNRLKNSFLVCNCNGSLKYDLDFLIRYHKHHNSTVTIYTNDTYSLAGVYIVEPKIFNYFDEQKFISLEDDIFPKLLKTGEIVVCPELVS